MKGIREFERESNCQMCSIQEILTSYALNTRDKNCINYNNHTDNVVRKDIKKYLDIWFNMFKGYPVEPIVVVYNLKEEDKYEVVYGNATWTAICNLDIFFEKLHSDKEYQKRFYIENDSVSFKEFSFWTTIFNDAESIDTFIPYMNIVKGASFNYKIEILVAKLKIMQEMMYDEYKDTILYSELKYNKL